MFQSDHFHGYLGQENVQVSSIEKSHGSRNSQHRPPVIHQFLSMPFTGTRYGYQNSQESAPANHHGLRMPFTGNISAQKHFSATNGVVKIECHQPAKVSLPSFIHRLMEFNVQDSAGNTSGARFVSSSFNLMSYILHLCTLGPLNGHLSKLSLFDF